MPINYPYTPDATESSKPADSDAQGMSHAEMRTLKEYIAALVASFGTGAFQDVRFTNANDSTEDATEGVGTSPLGVMARLSRMKQLADVWTGQQTFEDPILTGTATVDAIFAGATELASLMVGALVASKPAVGSAIVNGQLGVNGPLEIQDLTGQQTARTLMHLDDLLIWSGKQLATNDTALFFGEYTQYAKNPPAGLGWNANIPLPTGIKVGKQFLCNKKPEDYVNPATFPNTLYVDRLATGTGTGASWTNAYTSIYAALLAVEASGVATRILVNASSNYEWGDGPTQSGNVTYMTVNFSVEAVYGRLRYVAGSVGDQKTWTLEGSYDHVYKSAISQSISCVDLVHDSYLKHVTSVVAVADTPNSIYFDGTTLYVHRYDRSEPDNDFLVIRNFPGFSLGGSANYLVRNVDVYGGNGGGFRAFEDIAGNGTPTITEAWSVHDNCSASYCVGTSFAAPYGITGFVIEDRTFAALFDCKAYRTGSDGFSGSEFAGLAPHILAVNCTSFESGTVDSTRQSCNGITMHGGSKLVDIGGYYSGSAGTNVGHVDSTTRAWHFGTQAGDSDGDGINGGGLYWGAFGVWGSAVTMWLDFCRDFGSPIGVHKSVDAICYIRNHSGTGTIADGVTVLDSAPTAIKVIPD